MSGLWFSSLLGVAVQVALCFRGFEFTRAWVRCGFHTIGIHGSSRIKAGTSNGELNGAAMLVGNEFSRRRIGRDHSSKGALAACCGSLMVLYSCSGSD